MSRQVKAPEIPHQVPEDDGVLAEKLVGVDHLVGQGREANMSGCVQAIYKADDEIMCVCVYVWKYLISLILQQGLQLLAQHQGAEVWYRHRLGVWTFGPHSILTDIS